MAINQTPHKLNRQKLIVTTPLQQVIQPEYLSPQKPNT
jgi:hypothetical protein